jgi:hypothetical protein
MIHCNIPIQRLLSAQKHVAIPGVGLPHDVMGKHWSRTARNVRLSIPCLCVVLLLVLRIFRRMPRPRRHPDHTSSIRAIKSVFNVLKAMGLGKPFSEPKEWNSTNCYDVKCPFLAKTSPSLFLC